MNLDQAASYLQITRSALDRWIRQGLLANAGVRGGSFDENALCAWAKRHGIAVKEIDKPLVLTRKDLLVESIKRGAVTHAVPAKDSRAAIESALQALELPQSSHRILLSETLERERLAATSLGHGLAIPHPRRPPGDLVDEPLVSVSFLERPLDWAAVDGQPVSTVFLLLSPNTALHLKMLTRIAFALRSPGIEEFLQSQPSAENLIERFSKIHKPS